MVSKGVVRPPLRWAGSKRQLLPALRQFWRDSDRRYIEAFAGSACLFFDLKPHDALLNDANTELISAYREMARDPAGLYSDLLKLPVDAKSYYSLRSAMPKTPREAAVRFFYLNRYCFNGIYRTNKSGQFNVPFGRKTGGFPSKEEWLAAASLLSRAVLTSTDFEAAVLGVVQSGDFIYLDPPYAVSNRRIFVQYSANEFGVGDIERLRHVMAECDAKGATFVVSYALSPETAKLAKGWHCTRRMAQRNVAGFSLHRRRAIEVFITNDESRFAKAAPAEGEI